MNKSSRRLLPGAVLLLAAFQLPAPSGPVNDFAGVLPAAREEALRARLHAHERETGTAVVVATVPTLGGRTVEEYATALFNRWGVGPAGSDRGVLLLVAPNDRRARIEVGYGLEDRIPDAAARRIMDEQIVPHFRRGDFAGGIDAGVDALLAVLAPPGPPLTAERLPDDPAAVPTAERLFEPGPVGGGALDAGRPAPADADPLIRSPAGDDTGGGSGPGAPLAFVAAVAAAVWVVVRVRELRRRAALRKRLREYHIPARIAALDHARRALEELCGRAAGLLPLPADQERIAGAAAVIASAVRGDEEELAAARALIDADPDGAAALLERAEGRERILALWREIEDRIEAYGSAHRDAPAALERGSGLLLRAGAACDAAEREGYRTPRGALGEAEAELERARALLAGTPPDPEAAVRAARPASELLERTASEVAAMPETRQRVADAVPRLREAAARVAERAAAANAAMELLRARHPESVWEAAGRDVDALPEILQAVARRLDEAERANGMDVQDFALASGIVREVERTLAQADAATGAPSALLDAQEAAARECAHERGRAEEALRDAARACRGWNVGLRTRARLRNVAQAFERIDPDAGSVDFFQLLGILRAVTAESYAVAHRARRDIQEAEDARRRRAEEADRRSWESVSTSSSHGGGGGGGGFGGGRSGGAGASGSW